MQTGVPNPFRPTLSFDLRAKSFGLRRVNVAAKVEPNYLARQNFLARTELNKLDLAFSIGQNFRECVVYKIELGLIEPKRYGESQFFGRAG